MYLKGLVNLQFAELAAEVNEYQRKQQVLHISEEVFDKVYGRSRFWLPQFWRAHAVRNATQLYSQTYGVVCGQIMKLAK